MLGRKKVSSSNFDTVIGKNTSFKGDITCEGSLRVDGCIEGNINIEGNVLIGKDGIVKGNIEAVNVQLSGTLEGNVKATGVLKVLSSSKLLGDVLVKSFIADEGAIFQGKCEMMELTENQSKKSSRSRTRRASKSEDVKDESNEEVNEETS